VWKGEGGFEELLAADSALETVLSARELSLCFDASRTLRHVDAIYARAFPAD